MVPRLAATRLFVPADRICAVKNILEGYDNLALITTLDASTGEILIRHQDGAGAEVLRIVDAVCPFSLPSEDE